MKLTVNDLKTKPKEGESEKDILFREEKRRSTLLKELKQSIQQASGEDTDAFTKFAVKYWKRPDLFARECIIWPEGEGLTEYQSEILLSIPTKERVCVRGPRGLGKSCVTSLAILWFVLTREGLRMDHKTLVTAGNYNQIRRYFFRELHKWANRIDWEKVGRPPFIEKQEILTDAIQLKYGECFAISPDQPSGIEGMHGDQVFLCIDEAKSVPDAIFESLEGVYSAAGESSRRRAFSMVISTPGLPIGTFYRVHAREKGYEHWHPIHVKLERAIEAGMITNAHIERLKAAWGEGSSLYLTHCLGEFASDDQDGIIPLSWILQACDRFEEAEANS